MLILLVFWILHNFFWIFNQINQDWKTINVFLTTETVLLSSLIAQQVPTMSPVITLAQLRTNCAAAAAAPWLNPLDCVSAMHWKRQDSVSEDKLMKESWLRHSAQSARTVIESDCMNGISSNKIKMSAPELNTCNRWHNLNEEKKKKKTR